MSDQENPLAGQATQLDAAALPPLRAGGTAGCSRGEHDFTQGSAIIGETNWGKQVYHTIIYCRKCPYHYFPQQNE